MIKRIAGNQLIHHPTLIHLLERHRQCYYSFTHHCSSILVSEWYWYLVNISYTLLFSILNKPGHNVERNKHPRPRIEIMPAGVLVHRHRVELLESINSLQ